MDVDMDAAATPEAGPDVARPRCAIVARALQKAKRRREASPDMTGGNSDRQKLTWVRQKGGLPKEAVKFTMSNTGAQTTRGQTPDQPDAPATGRDDQVNDNEPMDTEQPHAARRPHRPAAANSAAAALPNLSAAFTAGKASIGPLVQDPSGKAKPKPPAAVDVVWSGPARAPHEHLVQLPGGKNPHRVNKVLTVSEHFVAKQYSDDNGYSKDGTCLPAGSRPAHPPLRRARAARRRRSR